MNFAAVNHRCTDNFCYILNKDELAISILTGYEVEEVVLIYEDPFQFGIAGGKDDTNGNRIPLYFKKRLHHQLWWTTTIKPEYKRARYYFEIKAGNECWYFFEDGFLTVDQFHLPERSKQFFIFPWMNPCDIVEPPKWVKETVWYQIFTERFCNGNKENDPDWVKPWREEGKVKNSEFFGGDLEGIIEKLDYIRSLGINGIYLTPINTSPSTHKYDVWDYEEIDPFFGNEEVLKRLINIAHNKGIKVMLDAVFNHCGAGFLPWTDVLENGERSKYFDWFMINECPFDFKNGAARKGHYYTFAFYDEMPKLNTGNCEVQEYFIRICEKWVKEYKVDGIRLDVANEISHSFAGNLNNRIKAIDSEVYILGELWHDSINWLRGKEYDGVMNYPLGQSIKDFWADPNLTKEEFEFTINRCYTRYMQQTNDVLFNLLDSHDTQRLRTFCKDEDEFYQQLIILFTMPGSPCVFYGTEIQMEGDHDPDCRRCMPWESIASGKYNSRIEELKKIISLRIENDLMKSRNFHFTGNYKESRVIEYQKLGWIDDYIEVIINLGKNKLLLLDGGEELYSRKAEYEGSKQFLRPGGIIIRKQK